jgi:dsDNA-binding SOS-regulon protein
MRNVSGYLTDDGKFFQDKKEAEAHEKLLGVNKLIEDFLRENSFKNTAMDSVLQQWERYKTEMTK